MISRPSLVSDRRSVPISLPTPLASIAFKVDGEPERQGFLVEKITATRSLLLLLGMPINRAFLLTLPRATNIP